MAIDQGAINNLLDTCNPSDQSDRVLMCENANMMTALNWFTKITGQRLSLAQLTGNKAAGGFYLHTHADTVGGNAVNVNLRGGSSSTITTEYVHDIMTKDHQYLGTVEKTSKTPGCPTIDITNPQHLGQAPRVVNCNGRIEIKFTTTYEYSN